MFSFLKKCFWLFVIIIVRAWLLYPASGFDPGRRHHRREGD